MMYIVRSAARRLAIDRYFRSLLSEMCDEIGREFERFEMKLGSPKVIFDHLHLVEMHFRTLSTF